MAITTNSRVGLMTGFVAQDQICCFLHLTIKCLFAETVLKTSCLTKRRSLPGTYCAVNLNFVSLNDGSESEERIDISNLANDTAVVITACT